MIALSDLHLGPGGRKEEFKSAEILCDFLYENKDETIIIVGDLAEMWQVEHVEKIYLSHTRVCQAIYQYVDFLVRGNHDGELKDFFGLPYHDEVIIGNTIFIHGHQFDTFNSTLSFLSKILSYAIGLGEKYIHTDTEKYLKARLNKVGKYGDPERYKECAVDFAKERGGNKIVMGHTHKKYTGDKYINTGHCTYGNFEYQEV